MPKPWYEKGLCWECVKGCTICCNQPGYIVVEVEEALEIAKHLRMRPEDFKFKYLVPLGAVLALHSAEGVGCPFITPAGCKIYTVRPKQCVSFPWWAHYLETAADFGEVTARCPGAGGGKRYSAEEIDERMWTSPKGRY